MARLPCERRLKQYDFSFTGENCVFGKKSVFFQIRMSGSFAVDCLSNIVPCDRFWHEFQLFCKEITSWKVGWIRKVHKESADIERKMISTSTVSFPWNILFFPQTSVFLRRIFRWSFGEETTFCRGNAFSFWKASSAKFGGWQASRGSRLPCLSSLTVSSQWATFKFPLIDFLCFQLSPSEQQRFYRLRT